jgi:hypothetical protein
MKKNGALIITLLLLAGCYTQFARRERVLTDQYVPPDSLMSQDSVRANIPDTLRVNNNQVCYWTRDIYGRPELRCDDSYYGRDWYRYNNSPWWNSSSAYYYGDNNYYGWDEPCPAYYYYDNTCGACRYYRDYPGQRDWWWNSSGRGSSYSSSKSSTLPRYRANRTDGVPSASERASGSSSSQTTKRAVGTPGSGTKTVIGETNKSDVPIERSRRSRTDGVPSSGEVTEKQKTNDAAVREMNKQSEPDQSQQQAPPPSSQRESSQSSSQPQQSAPQQNASPPPDRSGQDNSSGGDNHRERRNSRGY